MSGVYPTYSEVVVSYNLIISYHCGIHAIQISLLLSVDCVLILIKGKILFDKVEIFLLFFLDVAFFAMFTYFEPDFHPSGR